MKWLIIFIIIFLVLIQSSVASNFAIKSIAPNFLLSFLIALAFFKNFQQSVGYAFFGGLFLDLIIGLPFGLITFGFVLTIALVNFIFSNFLAARNLLIIAGLGFAAILFYFLSVEILLKLANLIKLTDLSSDFFYNILHLGFPSAIYNTFLIVLFYLGIGRLENR